jgi:hypothetical protein
MHLQRNMFEAVLDGLELLWLSRPIDQLTRARVITRSARAGDARPINSCV